MFLEIRFHPKTSDSLQSRIRNPGCYSSLRFSPRNGHRFVALKFVYHAAHNRKCPAQGRDEGAQGGSNAPGAESLLGRRMTAGAAEKSQ